MKAKPFLQVQGRRICQQQKKKQVSVIKLTYFLFATFVVIQFLAFIVLHLKRLNLTYIGVMCVVFLWKGDRNNFL
jgi:hypothetical protein